MAASKIAVIAGIGPGTVSLADAGQTDSQL